MKKVSRLLPLFGFVLAGLCLALPFAQITHEEESFRFDTVWSGTDLTVGGKASTHYDQREWGNTPVEERPSQEKMTDTAIVLFIGRNPSVPAQPAFHAAVLLMLAGAMAGILLTARQRQLLGGLAGMAATLTLGSGEWLALNNLAHRFPQASPIVTKTISPGYGFWIAMALLFVAGSLNLVFLAMQTKERGGTPV